MKKLKRFIIVLFLFLTAFTIYVIAVNRNSVNMTPRQKILKAVYPAFMWFTKLSGTNRTILENKKAIPPVSFYSLQATAVDGTVFAFSSLKGKKVLIVNTASDCGYTDQYEALEKLYQQYKGKLEVIAFPANDFKQQEKGTDADIASFCKKNYAVSFLIMAKSVVVPSDTQNPVYQWLTSTAANGWNSKAPSWNFAKYLIDEEGKLVNYFGPSVSPVSKEVMEAVEKS
jgi:glutathione peroxidase